MYCPNCKTQEFTFYDIEFDDNDCISIEVECNDCGHIFNPTFYHDPPFDKIDFYIGDFGPYPGYTQHKTWNGWGTPHFEFKTIIQILTDMFEFEDWDYNPKTDEFECNDLDSEHCLFLSTHGKEIIYNKKRIHVYSLGSNEWTWAFVPDTIPEDE
ncbi:hypothetical protein [Bacteroides sp.]|uniref:hypothetical protein n=1 Tax=Bacteroides sp. TaxID=29523 RepID=UPI002639151C|nr:hypothetical protein [Bacteroides sp.]MDD3039099.1 hypothetical protein [Bacteroides sp.]